MGPSGSPGVRLTTPAVSPPSLPHNSSGPCPLAALTPSLCVASPLTPGPSRAPSLLGPVPEHPTPRWPWLRNSTARTLHSADQQGAPAPGPCRLTRTQELLPGLDQRLGQRDDLLIRALLPQGVDRHANPCRLQNKQPGLGGAAITPSSQTLQGSHGAGNGDQLVQWIPFLRASVP